MPQVGFFREGHQNESKTYRKGTPTELKKNGQEGSHLNVGPPSKMVIKQKNIYIYIYILFAPFWL